ncbi:bacterio-opsin activator [Haloterrigena sp. H1]|uniref:helix-turn-helix domain-containing protein n=1 Tax=Haloterrigena sp. H1 TaxID=2552943 RepID=UPI00110E4253|nr:helix-turn-helix domain-containing protein [Haloterrigena sp. H1]TMT77988.1 bacterio-opsin activator [Haloterrigena sp. H1]TMT80277.1 bacterio-opsin activator [Haloterrigena sp. H1]
MATVAEFTIPAEGFPLGSVFNDFPGVEVELERVVPTNKAIIPYFWVRGVSAETEHKIEEAFRRHTDVQSVHMIDEVDGEYLMQAKWKPGYQGILKAIAEHDVVLISGAGTAENWKLEVRSENQEEIADFQQYLRKHEMSAELTSLHALAKLRSGTEYDLTEGQREALVLAYERGYFDSPREITLAEIAEEFGITAQSLGSRLRRGNKRLIRSTLIE